MTRLVIAAVVGMGAAALVGAPTAFAQVGLGAERYEVTITPPKRPGSEPAPESAPTGIPPTGVAPTGIAPKKAAPAKAAPPVEDPDSVLGAGDSATPEGNPGAAPAASRAAAPSAGTGVAASNAAEPAATRAASNLPMHTLQVGAFRTHKSATQLQDALAASFQDVAIVEVQSGGESLYRVNVGRMPHGPALEELKRRLVSAGHPAFEVAAPAPAN